MYVSYVYDPNDPYEVVGYGDYVFISKVNEIIDTRYLSVQRVNLWKKFALPYTQYSMNVMHNIKGTLEINASIVYEQFGGVSINSKSIDLVNGDELLESVKFYIIAAAKRADGSFGSVAPLGHKKLYSDDLEEILTSEEYKEFIEYYENESFF